MFVLSRLVIKTMWDIYSIYPLFLKPFISSIVNCFKDSNQFIFIQLKHKTPFMNQILDKTTTYVSYFTQMFETKKGEKRKNQDPYENAYQIENKEFNTEFNEELNEDFNNTPKKQKSINNQSNEWVETIYRINSSGSNEKIKNIPTLNLYSEKHNSIRELNKENLIKNNCSNPSSPRINIRHQNNSHETLLRESPRTIAFSGIPKYYCGFCSEELNPNNPTVMGYDKTFCSFICRTTFSMKYLKPSER